MTAALPAAKRDPGADPPRLVHGGEALAPSSGPVRLRAAAPPSGARLVIVDDDPTVLEVLRLHLESTGYRDLLLVSDSSRVMDILRVSSPDLLLTDIRMPGVDGLELLAEVRAEPHLAHLPVVVLTASLDAQTRLSALELGASDFLAKPVDPSELTLRLRNILAMKAYQDQLAASRRESDHLLLSILPRPVADRLKRGETVADHFDEVTVLFADLVQFTNFASQHDAHTVLEQLNRVFGAFDQIVEARGLEKIKTIGDSYMLAGGAPTPIVDQARVVVDAGLAMVSACARLAAQGRSNFQVRIGVHTGPVVAGVIGTKKFTYDLWGDTVNVASRMESHGVAGRVQISDATRLALDNAFVLEQRGHVDIKGKGPMVTWLVRDRRAGG